MSDPRPIEIIGGKLSSAPLRNRYRLGLASAGLLSPYLRQSSGQRWLARAHLLPHCLSFAILH
jgi:hypothetical protein